MNPSTVYSTALCAQFGRYQIWVCLLGFLLTVVHSWLSLSLKFVGLAPEFRCGEGEPGPDRCTAYTANTTRPCNVFVFDQEEVRHTIVERCGHNCTDTQFVSGYCKQQYQCPGGGWCAARLDWKMWLRAFSLLAVLWEYSSPACLQIISAGRYLSVRQDRKIRYHYLCQKVGAAISYHDQSSV